MLIRKKLKILMPAAHLTNTDIRLCLVQSFRLLSSRQGSKKSSESRNIRYSPFASFIPWFLAAPPPAFSAQEDEKRLSLFHIFTDDFHRIVTRTIIHAKYFQIL